MKRHQTGIVFACGGIMGYAWSLLALQRYARATGFDPRTAAALVGTSAGSILATELGAGLSVDELVERLEATVRASSAPSSSTPPRPRLRWPSIGLLGRGIRGEVPIHVALSGLVPEGSADSAMLAHAVDGLVFAGQWVPHPRCLVVALDVLTGERVAFGRAPAPPTSSREAVRASCAIPGWCAPVEVAGRRYIDGGVASPTSADLLANDRLDEVLIFSPMTSSRPAPARSFAERLERGMRASMSRTLSGEVRALEQAGTRVVRFEPTAHELWMMGANFMDPRRRPLLLDAWIRLADR